MAKILKFPDIKKRNLLLKGVVDNKYIFTEKIAKNTSIKDIHQILINQLNNMGLEVTKKEIKDE